MSTEAERPKPEGLWGYFAQTAWPALFFVWGCLILHFSGFLERASLIQIGVILNAVFSGTYILLGILTRELWFHHFRIRFDRRPIVFLLGFAFVALFFIEFLLLSFGINLCRC